MATVSTPTSKWFLIRIWHESVVRLLVVAGVAVAALTIVFWVRSYKGSPDSFTWKLGETRYTARSRHGIIGLLTAPRHSASYDVSKLMGRLNNDDVIYQVLARWTGSQSLLHGVPFPTSMDGASNEVVRGLATIPRADAIALMLEALEDDHRVAAAHVWLTQETSPNGYGADGIPNTYPMVSTVNGLRAEVHCNFPDHPLQSRPRNAKQFENGVVGQSFGIRIRGPSLVRFDAGQFPAIRRSWHEQFDREILSLRYSYIVTAAVAVCFIPLALSLRKRVFSDGQSSARTCKRCSYDLRASLERCPECGLSITAADS